MFKRAFSTKRLVTDAVLTAVFFVLSLYSVKVGMFKFTFDSLPCVLAVLLFSPLDGFLVAFLGTFAEQMLTYGFTVTTLLWMLAPALRALVLGLLLKVFPNPKKVLFLVFCAVSGFAVTIANTAVTYLDAKLFDYYTFALVFGVVPVRIVCGILASVLTGAVSVPIVLALEKAHLTESRLFQERRNVAYCGLDCEKCDAYKATVENDDALREKTAELWTKLNGVTITKEQISCLGCRGTGVKTVYCESLCLIRKCAEEKGCATCGNCGSKATCGTLSKVTDNNPAARKNLHLR